MSWFNREMICGKCSEKEKQYKMFNAALMAAEEAERKGDENFPGIGLPDEPTISTLEICEFTEEILLPKEGVGEQSK